MATTTDIALLLQLHVKSGEKYRNMEGWTAIGITRRGPAPSWRCKNGLSADIQASATHHCKPRNDEGPYTHFEVYNFGDMKHLLLEEYPGVYNEDDYEPFGSYPLRSLVRVIERCGGPDDETYLNCVTSLIDQHGATNGQTE